MSHASTLLELAGLALVVAAAWMASPLAGVLAAGVACLAVGYALGDR